MNSHTHASSGAAINLFWMNLKRKVIKNLVRYRDVNMSDRLSKIKGKLNEYLATHLG